MDNKSLIIIILILLVGSGVAYWYKKHSKLHDPQHQQQEWNDWNNQQVPPNQTPPATPPNQQPPQQPLPKPNSYVEALAQSKQTSKPMLLYFGADWCHFCVKMAPIFETAEVQAELDKFIFYKVNVDQEKEVSRKYNIGGIPAYVIADSSEKTLKKGEGTKSSIQFVKWANGSDTLFGFKRWYR